MTNEHRENYLKYRDLGLRADQALTAALISPWTNQDLTSIRDWEPSVCRNVLQSLRDRYDTIIRATENGYPGNVDEGWCVHKLHRSWLANQEDDRVVTFLDWFSDCYPELSQFQPSSTGPAAMAPTPSTYKEN